jgi:hypothetical protein
MEDDIFKRILQDKQFHLQLKSEQKEIIQNVLEKNNQWQHYPRASITFIGNDFNSNSELQITIRKKKKRSYMYLVQKRGRT